MAQPYKPPPWLRDATVAGLLVLFAVCVVADIFVAGYDIPREIIWIGGAVIGLVLSINIGLGGGGK